MAMASCTGNIRHNGGHDAESPLPAGCDGDSMGQRSSFRDRAAIHHMHFIFRNRWSLAGRRVPANTS